MSDAVYILDMHTYPRKEHFDYFRSLAYPYVGVTVNVEICALMKFCHDSGAPFFLSLLYAVSRAANAIPEFRQRIQGDNILEYPWCPTSHTVAKADGTFAYCQLRADQPFELFLHTAQEAQKRCHESGSIEEEALSSLSYLFITCLPWLSYTSLIQPVPFPADSNPRISWGRRFEEGGRTLLPLSVLCHHALVDGLHISRFYEALDFQIGKLGHR